MRIFIAVLLALLLSGCGKSGPTYLEAAQKYKIAQERMDTIFNAQERFLDSQKTQLAELQLRIRTKQIPPGEGEPALDKFNKELAENSENFKRSIEAQSAKVDAARKLMDSLEPK